ncbi:MAG TPA: hypothetical protein DCX85_02420 [Tyzzerella sp.]|nr:hypothetical protein [Tyzzerella sp.]
MYGERNRRNSNSCECVCGSGHRAQGH